MKRLIFFMILLGLSKGQELVLEQTLYPSDFGLTEFVFVDDPFNTDKIQKNHDANNDGYSDVIMYHNDSLSIFDIKNVDIIETTVETDEFTLTSFEHITCEECLNMIVIKRHSDPDYYLIDFSTNLKYQLCHYTNMLSIQDIDNDGLKEIIFYVSSVPPKIEIWGSGTSASVTFDPLPNLHFLNQNYPNPFNPITSIEYQVQLNGDVILNIYDLLGNKIKTLVNDKKVAGDYQVKWDGTNDLGAKLSSGQYFYQLKVGDFVSTKKMVLLK